MSASDALPSPFTKFLATDAEATMPEIVQVWRENLEEACDKIADIHKDFPYVALDTEFPGIVARPISYHEYDYKTIKCNVDLLNVIQVGLTFSDSKSRLAEPSTFQFNFKFSLTRDILLQESIDFLIKKGVDFDRAEIDGIEPTDFGDRMFGTEILMNPNMKWITYHGCYDFGFLLKLLTQKPLPYTSAEFLEQISDYFPCLYDVRILVQNADRLQRKLSASSLSNLATTLGISRHGPEHQAGSDSLLTSKVFFKLVSDYFDGFVHDDQFLGIIYGVTTHSPRVPPLRPTTVGAAFSLNSGGYDTHGQVGGCTLYNNGVPMGPAPTGTAPMPSAYPMPYQPFSQGYYVPGQLSQFPSLQPTPLNPSATSPPRAPLRLRGAEGDRLPPGMLRIRLGTNNSIPPPPAIPPPPPPPPPTPPP